VSGAVTATLEGAGLKLTAQQKREAACAAYQLALDELLEWDIVLVPPGRPVLRALGDLWREAGDIAAHTVAALFQRLGFWVGVVAAPMLVVTAALAAALAAGVYATLAPAQNAAGSSAGANLSRVADATQQQGLLLTSSNSALARPMLRGRRGASRALPPLPPPPREQQPQEQERGTGIVSRVVSLGRRSVLLCARMTKVCALAPAAAAAVLKLIPVVGGLAALPAALTEQAMRAAAGVVEDVAA
jgi:hypothetical protein